MRKSLIYNGKFVEKMHTKIMGMGAFHTICNFLVTIGNRF